MNDIVLDTNIFLLLIIGWISPHKIPRYSRTSIYDTSDYEFLLKLIGNINNIITCPNVWTEVDNLCNTIRGDDKYKYLSVVTEIMDRSIEKYYESKKTAKEYFFSKIGLTDSILLLLAKESKILISGDSELCDYARAHSIEVFDFKEYINLKKFSG